MRVIFLLTILLSAASTGYSQRFADKISQHLDIDYAGTKNPRQALDLYLPNKPSTTEPLPVICFIHGGAWRAGNKKAGRNHLAPYVSSGNYAGISIAYRLTGETHWPAQIHDCKAAIRWIRANAKTYNLNPEKIAAWGTSAGGHLVAMLGTSGGIKQLEGELGPNLQHSSRVSAVVDFFGPSELLTMADHPSRMDHNAPGSPESMLVGGALQKTKQTARAASPVSYVTPDDPPFLIVHGTADPLVPYPQSQTLHRLLKSAN
ncbi:MAG: alpha/beta hydrolase, partial [Verrucomicrobiales bacterium]|nr:alpha/beta hydrolase [Verrucomicrobiales bacterium]